MYHNRDIYGDYTECWNCGHMDNQPVRLEDRLRRRPTKWSDDGTNLTRNKK